MANAKSIKVIYFDFTGRGELLRHVLTAGGKMFEDVRIDGQKWQTLKPSAPFGQLPYVEIDGKKYAQTWAIANYFAREFGLYGKTNMESMKIDQVAQIMEDFIRAFAQTLSATDEAKKAEINKKLKEEDGPRFLDFYENILGENSSGYVVGSSLTLGDIIIFDVCTGLLSQYVEHHIGKCPKVKALVDRVGSHPRIKPYMAARK